MKKIFTLYSNKNYYDALAGFLGYSVNKRNINESEINYYIGECYQKLFEYENAVKYYNFYIKDFNNTNEYIEETFINKSTCLNYLGKYDNSIFTLNAYIEKFPEGKYKPQALFLLGINYEYNNDKKSLEYFNILIEKYPDNDFSIAAKDLIEGNK